MNRILMLLLLALNICSASAATLVVKRGSVIKAEIDLPNTSLVEIDPSLQWVTVECTPRTGDTTLCNQTITVTNPAPPPPPPPPVVTCPASWMGYPWSAWVLENPTRFGQMRILTGGYARDWPNLGGLGIFEVRLGGRLAVEFLATAKLDLNGDGVLDVSDFDPMLKVHSWIESQGGGAANLQGVYFSISRCPGDFRIPTITPDANEPTLAFGCRNIAPPPNTTSMSGAMEYGINVPSSNSVCGLRYGERYYINFTLVNPLDGWQTNEYNCDYPGVNGACGVMLQSQ